MYRNVRFYDKALKVIKEIESLLLKIADRQLARYYHRSAAVYNELQYLNQDNSYLDTAISFSNLSVEISLKNIYDSYLATSYNELGTIYERLEKWDEALKYYNKSILLWKDKGLFDYANAIKNKGSYFLNRKEFDSSIFYFNQGLTMAASINNYRFNMETLWGLKQ